MLMFIVVFLVNFKVDMGLEMFQIIQVWIDCFEIGVLLFVYSISLSVFEIIQLSIIIVLNMDGSLSLDQ